MGFLCTILDLIVIALGKQHLKQQGHRSFFSVGEWLQAFSMSTFNMLFMNWPVSIVVFNLWRLLYGSSLISEDAPWLWYVELPKLGICGLVVEFWFYWTHLALHIPYPYRKIHKFHHVFKAPIAVASVYAFRFWC